MTRQAVTPLRDNTLQQALKRSKRSIETETGATANLVVNQNQQCLEIRDERQQLLFSYNVASGQGTLSMPRGDLRLQAPAGNIELSAGGAVRCRSQKEVTLEVMAGSARRGRDSVLSLREGSAKLVAQRWKLVGRKADVLLAEVNHHGERLASTVAEARFVMQRIERVAVDIVTRAKRAFSQIEQQRTEAGRLTTLVDGGYSVQADHASISANDDVKINGERIHLG